MKQIVVVMAKDGTSHRVMGYVVGGDPAAGNVMVLTSENVHALQFMDPPEAEKKIIPVHARLDN